MSAPWENRNAIIPGRPCLEARNSGVASSPGRRESASAPHSMSILATSTLPLSAAACSGVVCRATPFTSSSMVLGLRSAAATTSPSFFARSSIRLLAASSSVAVVSSSPARHAPTSAAVVTVAFHLDARCRAARSGPAASLSASMASQTPSSETLRAPGGVPSSTVRSIFSFTFSECFSAASMLARRSTFFAPDSSPEMRSGKSASSESYSSGSPSCAPLSLASTTRSAAYLVAASSGVVHPGAAASTSAPLDMSKSTTSHAPPREAMCIGVESTTNAL
mmetsp:Transcript_14000/g.50262  ORF Transcript_14000/g.50262 Transcript_14000/m.50262 type:complete len:279 (-) Transcript_14000:1135-1971(-)